jgi:hypothetical protein
MSEIAAYLVDHVFPSVRVHQWALSLPIALRVLLAAQPNLVTTVLQVVQRKITRYLLQQAKLNSTQTQGGSWDRHFESPFCVCCRLFYLTK